MRASVVVAIVASVVALSASVEAQASIKWPTAIPPQELAPALKRLVHDREFQIIYSSELLAERRTQGAVGELTMDEALTKLLTGTGLTYQYLDEKTVSIVGVGTQPAKLEKKLDTALEQRSHASSNGEQRKSFWERFRVAQADEGHDTRNASEARSGTAPEEQGARLEEIVVTAQKREERLLDVPQSVSVLSADDLARRGATQFRDFADTVPGLSFSSAGAGNTQITLRGVTVGFDISPTVGIYLDEVPYGSSTVFNLAAQFSLDAALFDLDRIEVLRGPQGTLYGASAMGGLIKYVTPRPDTSESSGKAQAGISTTRGGGTNLQRRGLVERAAGGREGRIACDRAFGARPGSRPRPVPAVHLRPRPRAQQPGGGGPCDLLAPARPPRGIGGAERGAGPGPRPAGRLPVRRRFAATRAAPEGRRAPMRTGPWE